MSLLAAFSVPCAVLPALGFLWLMWWLDRYDREPWWIFGSAFLWGAIAAPILSLIALLPASLFLGESAAALALEGAVLAPLVEEPSKAAVLLLIARSRHFDNTTDGFVYGAASGIGFAMTENLLYFTAAAEEGDPAGWLGVVVMRTLYSALMHASATSVAGAALGWAKFRTGPVATLAFPLGLLGAFGIHALWNGLLIMGALFSGGFGLLDLLLFPVEFIVLFGIFQASLMDEARILETELKAEADAGVLPAEYVAPLSSWLRRSRPGWLPPDVDHQDLVRTATTLAFRLDQRRGGRGTPDVDEEIARLRRELRSILGPAHRPDRS